jgi:hypothetical protein
MNDQSEMALFGRRDPIGLCAACRHARVVRSARGSTFYLCQLSAVDVRFARYPHLPIVKCAGYEASANDEAEDPSHQETGIISSHQKPGTVS